MTRALSRRDRALALLIPLLMTLVAGVAIYRYHQVDQSSWQGVGFGMFATYEYTPARAVRLEVVTAGVVSRPPVPPGLEDEVERVLTAPGDDHTRALAQVVLERLDADEVELEVWGHDVSGGSPRMQIGFKLLARVAVG